MADRRRVLARVRCDGWRIAREMHDVLAHRVSLLSIQAGALELRADAPAGQVQHAAKLIRTTVHDGLEELRAAIDALREGHRRGPGARPASRPRRPARADRPEPSLSPSVTRTVLANLPGGQQTPATQRAQARDRLAALTPRELKVATRIGHGDADIAARLYMSLSTVKAHITRILEKTSTANRVQIALLMHAAARGGDRDGRR